MNRKGTWIIDFSIDTAVAEELSALKMTDFTVLFTMELTARNTVSEMVISSEPLWDRHDSAQSLQDLGNVVIFINFRLIILAKNTNLTFPVGNM